MDGRADVISLKQIRNTMWTCKIEFVVDVRRNSDFTNHFLKQEKSVCQRAQNTLLKVKFSSTENPKK